MIISVKVTRLNFRFFYSQNPKWQKVNRSNIFFRVYLGDKKYYEKKNQKKIAVDEVKYCKEIQFNCSMLLWLKLRMKKEDSNIVITSFNKFLRDLFYQDFFNYMNLHILAKELLHRDSDQIKEYAMNYMDKCNLSDDDIDLQTLLRNYRRYREDKNIDLYEFLEQLSDD